MALVEEKNIKVYDKLMKELDGILAEKRISYAQFALKMGIQTVAFYNRYKIYGFQINEMENFVSCAKKLPPNMIKCIRCSKEFLPKAKSVKRAFCKECRDELKKKDSANDALKFHYPSWVTAISNDELKKLVEQEFHIDEATALEMSKVNDIEEAKRIRSKRWDVSASYYKTFVSGIIR